MKSASDGAPTESPEGRLYREILARIEATAPGEGENALALAESAARAAEASARAEHDETARLKATANAIKREIADWKAWWAALPAERAPAEIFKLQIEVSRLAARLAGTEAAIAGRTAAHAHRHGLALALRARADALAAHGPAAETDIRRSLEAGLSAARAERSAETAGGVVNGTGTGKAAGPQPKKTRQGGPPARTKGVGAKRAKRGTTP